MQIARTQGSGLLVLNISRFMGCNDSEANRLSLFHMKPHVDSYEWGSLCEQAAVYMSDRRREPGGHDQNQKDP